jgi:hypothetical protein
MTPEEMKAMEGTEFLYCFESGRTMKSYVKKVDPETGMLSCWSFSLTTDCGTLTFEPENDDEEREGACCVSSATDLTVCESKLEEIKSTGKLIFLGPNSGIFSGCPF